MLCNVLLDHAPPFIIVKSIALLDHAPPFIIVKVIRNTEVLLPNFLWWPFLSESHIPCLAFISSLPRRAQARFIPKPWCKVGAKSKGNSIPWSLNSRSNAQKSQSLHTDFRLHILDQTTIPRACSTHCDLTKPWALRGQF